MRGDAVVAEEGVVMDHVKETLEMLVLWIVVGLMVLFLCWRFNYDLVHFTLHYESLNY